MSGRLFGVGVGPGDPELLTVKAQRIVAAVDVIAYPNARHGRSVARAIAAPHFRGDQIEVALEYPVTTEQTDHPGGYEAALSEFYDAAAAQLAVHLDAGRDVAVLCEGDPFFYGSYMYLHERLADRYATEVVPGVTSFSAAAAAAGTPLVRRDDILTVLPGTLPPDVLAARLRAGDAAVVIKLGRTFPGVADAARAGGRDRAGDLRRARQQRRRAHRAARRGRRPGAVHVAGARAELACPRARNGRARARERRRARARGPGLADARGAAPSWRPPTSCRLRDLPRARARAARAAPPRDRQPRRGRARAPRARAGGRRRARGGRLLGRPGHLRDGRRRAGGRRRRRRAGRRRGADRAGPLGHAGRRGPRRRAAGPRLLRRLAVGPAQAVGGRRAAPRRGRRGRPRPRALQPGVADAARAARRAPSRCCGAIAPTRRRSSSRARSARRRSRSRSRRSAALDVDVVDMRTLLIVGSSTTRTIEGEPPRVYTPRRYPA